MFRQSSHSSDQPPSTQRARNKADCGCTPEGRAQHLSPPENQAVSNLYGDYRDELSRALRASYGNGPPDPDDIAQDAFHKVLARGDLASIDNLKAFLWRTARNLVINAKRQADVRSRYDYEIENLVFASKGYDSSPETVIEAREQLAIINETLKTMPPTRSRAFILHRFDGLTAAEVGRKLGISRPAASKHIARAAADLSAAIDASSKI
ncbi:MAG: RNA polymerase sigma factor [Sphingomonadales bacterium]